MRAVVLLEFWISASSSFPLSKERLLWKELSHRKKAVKIADRRQKKKKGKRAKAERLRERRKTRHRSFSVEEKNKHVKSADKICTEGNKKKRKERKFERSLLHRFWIS